MTLSKLLFVTTALTASFLLPYEASAMQAPAAAAAAAKDTTKKTKAAAAAAPSAADIADAKAKGLVWVNKNTKVYHKSDNKFYGATKSGAFMTEADAQKAGYRAAQEPGTKKNAKTTAAPAATAAPAKK